jgi:DNA-binding LacI/PurR family transcriptional regulator
LATRCEALDGLGAVCISEQALGEAVVRHLAAAGYRRFAYVSSKSDIAHTQARAQAIESAAEALGCTCLVRRGAMAEASAASITSELLGGGQGKNPSQRPDAIIYDNEILTIGGYTAIHDADLRIGHDIAVVSCEDSAVSRALSPAVTSVSRDPAVLGAHAAAVLLNMLNGAAPYVIHEPPVSLAERESTQGYFGTAA